MTFVVKSSSFCCRSSARTARSKMSQSLRTLQNAIVRTPCFIRKTSSRLVSLIVLTLPEPRSIGSTNGQFQHKNSFLPVGEPSLSVRLMSSSPNIAFICCRIRDTNIPKDQTSLAFGRVAVQEMNWRCLRLPTAAHNLRRRRMINATCDPNRPV